MLESQENVARVCQGIEVFVFELNHLIFYLSRALPILFHNFFATLTKKLNNVLVIE